MGNRRTVLLLRVERFRRRRDFGSQKKDTENNDGEQHISGRVQGKSGGSDTVSKDRQKDNRRGRKELSGGGMCIKTGGRSLSLSPFFF